MKSKRYICKHIDSCQYAGSEHCAYGKSISEVTLNDLCGGVFRPQSMIYCDHPDVRAGVFLLVVGQTYIEGNCRTIWTPF